ncbi:MAG: SDR family NAD(P)-dependent oxidoreductase [Candidatus Thorarchaeota archaeon]
MVTKILVTGGCGFIGSNIVTRLLKEDKEVKVIDDLSSGNKNYIKSCLEKSKNCRFVKGSITDLEFLEKELNDMDLVIHEAANPDVRASKDNLFRDFEINVIGTINILHAMIKNNVPKIIFASSAGTVYGEAKIIPTPENTSLAPISHYGASKAASEQYMTSFSSLYNIEAISLRLGNIFGPPSNHGVMFDFYQKLKTNPQKLEILGDGKQIKTYLYVEDCVEAHIKAMEKKFQGHIAFNITSSESITVNEIAIGVVDAMGLEKVEFSYTGGERGWAGDVRQAIPDISKAEKLLDWKPKISTLEGIKRYIAWLQKQ